MPGTKLVFTYAETHPSRRLRPRAAPLVLRPVLQCHHRMYAGERPAAYRVLLQPEHLPSGRVREEKKRTHGTLPKTRRGGRRRRLGPQRMA